MSDGEDEPEYDDLYAQNVDLMEQLADMESKLAEFQDEVSELRDNERRLQEERDAAVSGRDRTTAALDAQAAQVKALERAKEDWAEERKRLEADMHDKEAKIDELKKAGKDQLRMSGDGRRGGRDRMGGGAEAAALAEKAETLTAEIAVYENQQTQLVDMLQATANERDELIRQKNTMEAEMDELQTKVDEGELDVAELKQHLLERDTDQQKVDDRQSEEREALRLREEALCAELETARREVRSLTELNADLKNTTAVGEKEREIDALKSAVTQSRDAEREAAGDASNFEAECLELRSILRQQDEMLAEKAGTIADREVRRTGDLTHQVHHLEGVIAQQRSHIRELETDKERLVVEIEQEPNWAAIADGQYGLSELVANQKQLRSELREKDRRLIDVQIRLSEESDAKELLAEAARRLKGEAGREESFEYDDLTLREHIQTRQARWESLEDELNEQVEALERERGEMLKKLREYSVRAGEAAISATSVSAGGLSPDQVKLVGEFATNLRTGALEPMPLDDQSRKLAAEKKEAEAKLRRETARCIGLEDALIALGENPRAAAALAAALPHQSGGGAASPAVGGASHKASANLPPLSRSLDAANGLSDSAAGEELAAVRAELRGLQATLSELPGVLAAAAATAPPSLPSPRRPLTARGVLDAEASHTPKAGAAQHGRLLASLAEAQRDNEELRGAEQRLAAQVQLLNEQLVAAASGRSKAAGGGAVAAIARPPLAAGRPPTPAASLSAMHGGVAPATPGRGHPAVHATPTSNAYGGMAQTPMSAMNHTAAMHTAMGQTFGGGFSQGNATPRTATGKQMHRRMMQTLTLADEPEVQQLSAQLIETLEQLDGRELELERCANLLAGHEQAMGVAREQLSLLYRDHAESERRASASAKLLREQADDAAAKCDEAKAGALRYRELAELSETGDMAQVGGKLKELTRRIVAFEVNEQRLVRRHAALDEALKDSESRRAQRETDAIEMEAAHKARIIYLEEYKAGAAAELDRATAALDRSVPAADYAAAMRELKAIREEHLELLSDYSDKLRELTGSRDLPRRLAAATQAAADLQVEASRSSARADSAEAQLVANTANLAAAVSASGSDAMAAKELGKYVSEIARFRGDAMRLDIELASSRQQVEVLLARSLALEAEVGAERRRADALEASTAAAKASADRAGAEERRLAGAYEGGATRKERAALQLRVDELRSRCKATIREKERANELADLAASQLSQYTARRREHGEELAALKAHCASLEAKTDDDLLTGRLQRQLSTTTASYKLFTKKYDAMRVMLRRAQATERRSGLRLDQRDAALRAMREKCRDDVSVLKTAILRLMRVGAGGEDDVASSPADAQTEYDVPPTTPGGTSSKAAAAAAAAAGEDEDDGGVARALKAELPQVLDVGALAASVKRLAAAGDKREGLLRAAEQRADELSEAVSRGKEEEASLARQVAELARVAAEKSPKSAAIAQRIMALTNQLKAEKLAALKGRRQVVLVRDERRAMERRLRRAEGNILELEKAKVEAETRFAGGGRGMGFSVSSHRKSGSAAVGAAAASGVDPFLLDFSDGAEAAYASAAQAQAAGAMQTIARLSTALETGPLSASAAADGGFGVGVDDGANAAHAAAEGAEGAMAQLQSLRLEVVNLAQEAAEGRSALSREAARADQAEAAAREAQQSVRYYEKQADAEGLARVPQSSLRASGSAPNTPARASFGGGPPTLSIPATPMTVGPNGRRGGGLDRQQQEQLQHVANTTIRSLRQLIDEKNKTVDRYKQRFDSAKREALRTAAADRAKIDELSDKLYRENEEAITQLRHAARTLERAPGKGGANTAGGGGNTLDQMEEASRMLAEREEANLQLEKRLSAEAERRQRAELRCGEALEEMERMKADMVTLAAQLQDAEERCLGAMADRSQKERVRGLQAQLGAKEKDLVRLRDTVLKLKNEFVNSEARRAADRTREASDGRALDEAAAQSLRRDVTDLAERCEVLQRRLTEVERENQKLKRLKERWRTDRDKLRAEHDDLSGELAKTKADARAVEDSLSRSRREAADARRDLAATRTAATKADGGGGGGPGASSGGKGARGEPTVGADRRMIGELKKEVAVLRAQNDALRSDLVDAVRGAAADGAARGPRKAASGGDGGRRLGDGGPGSPGGASPGKPARDHSAWRNEKRSKASVESMRKELAAAKAEAEEAKGREQQARGLYQRANADKEALQRRLQKSGGGGGGPGGAAGAGGGGGATAQETVGLEALRAKFAALEAELDAAKRRSELELPMQLEAARNQARAARAAADEAERELALAAGRAAPGDAAAARRSGADSHLRERAARDELKAAVTARREMEARVLDRDSAAMELRFDLEAKEAECARTQRRLAEVESGFKRLASQKGAAPGGGGGGLGASRDGSVAGGGDRTAGGRFKRERDLEGVVESLQRVVSKLKSENERLRGGAAEAAQASGADRKAREMRAKVVALTDELSALRSKAAAGDEAGLRLTQRQELVTQLRRRAKTLENDVRAAKSEAAEANRERASALDQAEAAARALREAETREIAARREVPTRASLDRREVSSERAGARAVAAEDEVRALRAELARRGEGGGGGGGGGPEELQHAHQTIAELKRELSAFDLAFFEEIEELKFNYSTAVARLARYEG